MILLIVLLLRIPSFFEPYWYGDEGIYLVIGQALQRGAILYRDIWDNKPPLLYLIYAIVPTLLWAKLTATACVLGTVYFVKKITKNNLSALICGILLSIPLLEGTIANAELYFILPIIITVYLLLNKPKYFLIGLCLTAAFLIKIPAIFDFMGLFLAWFIINRKIKPFFIMALPVLLSLLFFIIYFYLNQSLGDFITAVFLQNSGYVSVGSGSLSKLSNPLFIKGIILTISEIILIILYFKNKISKELLIFTSWFGFSLYGALLSNRPYPHYLLQIVPPIILLLNYLFQNIRKYFLVLVPLVLFLYLTLQIFSGNLYLIQDLISRHEIPYYSNFWSYITGQKSWADFANNFDSRTTTNYEIASYLNGSNLFVWGDNAFIYVLPNIPPTTKFIQAHHLTTVDKLNYDKIIEQINFKKPKFIVVIRPVRFEFQKLEELIMNKYKLVQIFGDSYIYEMLRDVANETANHILRPGAEK
ncbi:MAG: hypothetical protein Q7S14_01460 [bacterium]|nr:hypothetical protein [bacterium]